MPTRDSSLPYAELSRTYAKMRVEVASLIRIADASGCFQNVFSTGLPLADELGIEAVIDLGTKLSVSKDALSGDGKEKQTLESLEAARRHPRDVILLHTKFFKKKDDRVIINTRWQNNINMALIMK